MQIPAASSSDQVSRSAIGTLEQDGRAMAGGRFAVRTTLFIPPKRLRNQTWTKFIDAPALALLTGDTGFLGTIVERLRT